MMCDGGNGDVTMPLERIDLCGLRCPEPVMMLHVHFRALAAQESVWVITTDPTTLRDVPKFCHFLGHTLLEQKTLTHLPDEWRSEAAESADSTEYYVFHIQKS